MKDLESKEYSWKWITASELLSRAACEICQIVLTCHDGNCSMTIYNGENDTGEIVGTLKALQNRSVDLDVHHHIFCRRGLYVALDASCLGAWVQWFATSTKGGGS